MVCQSRLGLRARCTVWAGLALALCGRPAAAQDLKPKILIIFDSSGSMLDGNDRDGSPLCDNKGQSSRVYQLKEALFEALQGTGASEVDFALATYPMFVDPQRIPECADTCNDAPAPNLCSGHYYVTNAQDSESSSSNNACKVSAHDPSTQKTADCKTGSCPWYASYKDEVLKVPFGDPVEQVMLYFDQQEDAGAVAVLQNPEVRAGRSWFTPLGKSLFYAHGYFDKEVALDPGDYRKKCEKLVVAMFTDGQETCNTGSSNAFYPLKWATNLKNDLGVTTHTVAIDISEGLVEEIATKGGGSYYEVAGNASALKTAFLDIIAKSQVPTETCNGDDDDCDSLVDEDFPLKGTPCHNGKLGGCFRTGVYVCKADGSGVECDAADAVGETEICDGIDNDCDGEIDEIPGCIPCVPQPEICNGKDDNCNNEIDEDFVSEVCGQAVGECKPGLSKCENGQTICDGGVGPTEEICDGLDNDCDGQRDGIGLPCYPFDAGCDVQTGVCQGQCRLGTQQCNAVQQTDGSWTGEVDECLGAVGPTAEVCDGVDSDCDGEIDEDAECPGGSQCIEGACTSPCGSLEFVCPVGQVCKDNWCVVDTCDPVTCAAQNGVCKGGSCLDLCKDVTCAPLQKCERGVCVDDSCYQAHPCPKGERCVQGACVADPCSGVDCGAGKFCAEGQCLALCDQVSCGAGQSCRVVDDGAGHKTTSCVDDPCAGVTCGEGFACIDGRCDRDPCAAVGCASGQVCVAGSCVDDPCEHVDCPAGYGCERGSCVAPLRETTGVLATGAGGCACEITGERAGASTSLAWIVLGLLLLAGRRRRRPER